MWEAYQQLLNPPPLLAKGEEWIRIIVVLLIFVGPWLIRQIVAVAQKQNSAGGSPHAPPANGTSTETPWQYHHDDEVIHDVEVIEPPSVRDGVYRPAAASTIDPPRTLAPAVAPTLAAAVPNSASAAASAAASVLTQRATQLGGELSQSTAQRVEQHQHSAFDHSVGALGDSSDAVHEANQNAKKAVTARDIKTAFTDPTKVRQAIILNEILTPPTARW